MPGKTMGRILAAALITATLAAPLPARAATASWRAVSHPAWSWLAALWTGTFGGPSLPHRSGPPGAKQGTLVDPNGSPLPTDSCAANGCDPGTSIDSNR